MYTSPMNSPKSTQCAEREVRGLYTIMKSEFIPYTHQILIITVDFQEAEWQNFPPLTGLTGRSK